MTCKVTVPDTSKNVVITKYPTTLTEGQTGNGCSKDQLIKFHICLQMTQ